MTVPAMPRIAALLWGIFAVVGLAAIFIGFALGPEPSVGMRLSFGLGVVYFLGCTVHAGALQLHLRAARVLRVVLPGLLILYCFVFLIAIGLDFGLTWFAVVLVLLIIGCTGLAYGMYGTLNRRGAHRVHRERGHRHGGGPRPHG